MKLFRRIIFMFLTATVFLPAAAGALTNELEIDFPAIGGVKPGYSFGLANWVQYIFLFSLAIVGLAVIASFVYAGILWLTAGDNEGQVKRARDRIKSALVGLLLLLGSYIILNTINPDLVQLKNNIIELNIGSSGGIMGLNLEAGAVCYGDVECASRKCDMSWSILRSQSGKCVGVEEMGVLETGQRCDKDYKCKTGLCDKEGNLYKTCLDPAARSETDRKLGQKCSDNGQCAGKLCGYKDRGYKTCLEFTTVDETPAQ